LSASLRANTNPQKIGGAARPGAALAHELPYASGDRVRVDDALDVGLAVGCVGARESNGALEACFAGRGPYREVGHSPTEVKGTPPTGAGPTGIGSS
jgi:hypothetical protein